MFSYCCLATLLSSQRRSNGGANKKSRTMSKEHLSQGARLFIENALKDNESFAQIGKKIGKPRIAAMRMENFRSMA